MSEESDGDSRSSVSSSSEMDDIDGMILLRHIRPDGSNIYLGIVASPSCQAQAGTTTHPNPFYGEALRIESTSHPSINAIYHLIGVQVSERYLIYDFEDGWILHLMKKGDDIVYLVKKRTSAYHMIGKLDMDVRKYTARFVGDGFAELNELLDFISLPEEEEEEDPYLDFLQKCEGGEEEADGEGGESDPGYC